MSLKNIKSNTQAQKGFTIVELLIVVVVIAILAAITIVSYNGITNRANASASKSTAATWQKKVELYNSEQGNYPRTSAQVSGDTTKTWYMATGTGTSVINANPDASNGKSKVRVQACSSTATAPVADADVVGIKISYWEYDKSGGAAVTVNNIGATMGTGCVDIGTTAS